jgi:hypothetical protein
MTEPRLNLDPTRRVVSEEEHVKLYRTLQASIRETFEMKDALATEKAAHADDVERLRVKVRELLIADAERDAEKAARVKTENYYEGVLDLAHARALAAEAERDAALRQLEALREAVEEWDQTWTPPIHKAGQAMADRKLHEALLATAPHNTKGDE